MRLPAKNLRSYALLQVLQRGPGTFYQLCERASFDIDSTKAEHLVRHIFDGMLRSGTIRLDGIIYTLTERARVALQIASAPAAPGQVATPAYRGQQCMMPVRVVSRSHGARP